MSTITLRQALGVLAKSSPFSVKTVTAPVRDTFDHLKEYLYVEQNIELDFKKRLTSLRQGEIIFLCGSSGDGKSEILTRSDASFRSKFKFHLDASHSFAPHQSAIGCSLKNLVNNYYLAQLFDRSCITKTPHSCGQPRQLRLMNRKKRNQSAN